MLPLFHLSIKAAFKSSGPFGGNPFSRPLPLLLSTLWKDIYWKECVCSAQLRKAPKIFTINILCSVQSTLFLNITWVSNRSYYCTRPRGFVPVCSSPTGGQGLLLHHLLQVPAQEDGGSEPCRVDSLPGQLLLPVSHLRQGLQIEKCTEGSQCNSARCGRRLNLQSSK